MLEVSGTAWTRVRAQVAARWEAVDPLLPPPCAPPGCGCELVVRGADKQAAAIGTCGHWHGRPGAIDLTWGAARRFRLSPLAAAPDVASSLDGLLSLWRDHLAGVPEAGQDDTAAIVTWPSRDIDGAAALLRHGLVPLTVIAARPAGRCCDLAPAPSGITIRRAGPADLPAVASLGIQVVRFDQHFGDVTERPETAGALRREAARLLSRREPWVWLAERGGTPVGLLQAERPESARWIAPMVGQAPAAYLGEMFVAPGERSRGVGAALVARLHSAADAAGVAVTLLHYSHLNPLSGPFWSRLGYRPLWLTWEARPARTLR